MKELDEVLELVKKYFDFLFKEDAKVIFSDNEVHFGNFAVVLEATSLGIRVRFFRDRGTITIQVGPSWATPDWSGESWYDLIYVIAFLTEKQVLISGYWEDRFDDEKQLERLAKAFIFYYDQIIELFGTDVFYEKKDALGIVCEEISTLIYEPRRRSELQELLQQSGKFWENVN